MSNGDVILAVRETSRLFQAIVEWQMKEKDVVFVKCSDSRRVNAKCCVESLSPEVYLIIEFTCIIRAK